LYKLETGHSQSKPKSRTRQDAAAAVTKTRSTPANQVSDNKRIWTSSEISKLKPHEFEALEKELDLASRQGRII
jgi:FtsZ-interacting cell division protein YlmF